MQEEVKCENQEVERILQMTDLKMAVCARLSVQKTQQFIATNLRLQESCYVLIIFVLEGFTIFYFMEFNINHFKCNKFC